MDEISGSKTDVLGTKYILRLSRKDLSEGNNSINICNKSYSHTEFAVDGLMQDSVEKNINVIVQKKLIIPIIIKNSNLKIVEKDKDNLVVRPLAQHRIVIDEKSLGITEAGRYLAIKLNINQNIKYEDIVSIKTYFNDEEIKNVEMSIGKNYKNIVLIFKIPEYTNSTIFGWKSLREIYGNYFGIDSNQIGKRIDNPHTLTIKTIYNDKEYIIDMKIDTIDDYITNINYTYKGNFEDYNNTMELKEWLEMEM